MRLTIEAMTYGPDGLARTEEGKAVFVAGGLAGDVVEAHIVSDGASFARAQVDEVVEPSPSRVPLPDPIAQAHGGCPWAGLSREAQLAAKEGNLKGTLARIGRFTPDEVASLVRPIRFARDGWGYRNKIELVPSVRGGKFRLGIHGRDPEQVIFVDDDPLFDRKHARAVKAVAGALGYLGNSRDLEIERVGLRSSRRTGALEIALWTPTGPFPRAQVARVLGDAVKATSVVRVMTKGDRRARKVAGVEALAGEGSWTERLLDETMRVSAPSFFQVNTKAADILIELVMDALAPKPEEWAMDLYCGAGTFTLPLARACDFVSAVESYGPAVRDLRRNLDSADLANVDVIGGDAVREFPEQDADVLVVDPPRAGLGDGAIDLIASTSARDVAYVSCDPATLARDLRRFVEEGTFLPVWAAPVDLFPQTFHCETVVRLTRARR